MTSSLVNVWLCLWFLWLIFLLLLCHLVPNCTPLHPPGRGSPVLREQAAFGWFVFSLTFILVPSCLETGLLSYSSMSSSLLGIPFSLQTHSTHLEFVARLFCQASLLRMLFKLAGLHLGPIFTLNFCLMMIPAPAFSSCRLICYFRSTGRCMTLFTTSSLTSVLFPLLL